MLVDKEKKSTQGHRTDLDKLVEALIEGGLPAAKSKCPKELIKYPGGCRLFVAIGEPSHDRPDLLVVVYFADPGTGKTRAANLTQPSFTISMPIDGGQCWFDGYLGERHLIIDEMRGQINPQQLNQILDRGAYRAPVKGGFVEAHWTKVTITTNYPWSSWYKDIDQRSLGRRIHGVYQHPPWDLGVLPY